MGLGNKPDWRKEYEWVNLSDWEETPTVKVDFNNTRSLPSRGNENFWLEGGGRKILLVDLDNIRTRPDLWQNRMRKILNICRTADKVVLAGQPDSVKLARPHLAEFGRRINVVRYGKTTSEKYLLDAAFRITKHHHSSSGNYRRPQLLVVSHDFIFARLTSRGDLIIMSPGDKEVSQKLSCAAKLVLPLD